jgi:hypothetical protein
MLIQAASHEAYAATARFYERVGCALVSPIRDCYRDGDDMPWWLPLDGTYRHA